MKGYRKGCEKLVGDTNRTCLQFTKRCKFHFRVLYVVLLAVCTGLLRMWDHTESGLHRDNTG